MPSLLDSVPLFRFLDEPQRVRVSESLVERNYHQGDIVVPEGSTNHGLYVIKSGAVSIAKTLVDGSVATIATLSNGDVFGEMSLIDGSASSASVISTRNTSTLQLSPERFRAMMIDASLSSHLWESLARLLAERIRGANIRIADHARLNRSLCENPSFREFYTRCQFG